MTAFLYLTNNFLRGKHIFFFALWNSFPIASTCLECWQQHICLTGIVSKEQIWKTEVHLSFINTVPSAAGPSKWEEPQKSKLSTVAFPRALKSAQMAENSCCYTFRLIYGTESLLTVKGPFYSFKCWINLTWACNFYLSYVIYISKQFTEVHIHLQNMFPLKRTTDNL